MGFGTRQPTSNDRARDELAEDLEDFLHQEIQFYNSDGKPHNGEVLKVVRPVLDKWFAAHAADLAALRTLAADLARDMQRVEQYSQMGIDNDVAARTDASDHIRVREIARVALARPAVAALLGLEGESK